jgi:uncharacterized SAM-binding protein YcdF (DUF218 family)
MQSSPDQPASDLNAIAAWLALDDFAGTGPSPDLLRDLEVIVLFGTQVIAALTAACELIQRAPRAQLLISGGVGHATSPLYENLRISTYASFVRQSLIVSAMPEAEMIAVVATSAFQIPLSRILIENRSTNCGENARFSLEILKSAQPHGPVLLLQDPTMQRRSILTWAREAEIACVDIPALSHAAFVPRVEAGADGVLRLASDQAAGTWTIQRFIALLLGEIERLNDDEFGYGPKGKNFLPHVDIPAPVFESYLRLAASPIASQAVR